MEPRGIGPLYPSVDHGLLTRGGPLDSTKTAYDKIEQKERPSIKLGLSEPQLNPWLVTLSLASLYKMSITLSTRSIIS